jgi:threonine dehydratase
MTIISPFDDHAIMAGAGTTGLEMAEQLIAAGQKPDAVVINCSGAAVLSKRADFAGKTVAIVASGGSVDPAVYIRALAENPLKLT